MEIVRLPPAIRFTLITLLALLICSGCGVEQGAPTAREGRLQLASHDLTGDGVELNGEWLFYWGRLLSPDDFRANPLSAATGLIHLPGAWNGFRLQGHPLGALGAATFRLQVKLPADTGPLALRLHAIATAYRLWVNGVEVGERGRVGLDAAASRAEMQHDLLPLAAGVSSLDLVLQVANFHLQDGGVLESIRLGPRELLQRHFIRDRAFDYFSIGALLLLGLFFLGRYFAARLILKRSDQGALWFAAVSLLWGGHALFFGISGSPILRLWPMAWGVANRLDYLIFYLCVPVLTVLFTILFPAESLPRLNRLWLGLGVLFSLPVLIAPSALYSRMVHSYEFLGLVQMVYVLWILVRAIHRRQEGALPVMAGMVALSVTAVNDVLLSNGWIESVYLTSFGILALVLSQAHTLSLRSVRARQKVEQLSRELEEKNLALGRSDRLKDEFLANTSHELRTPLHGIIGLAESLREAAADGARSRDLALIAASGRRLANLVNDLLDFSRLRSRELNLNLTAVDLHAAVATVLAFCAPLADNKPLTLHNEVPVDLPPVRADEDRLQQILFNLLGNAIKFTDQGEVRIRAVLENGGVRISITDSGIGVPLELRDAVFRPFEQADGSTSRRHGGSGLGLGISRHLVELHGGRLELEAPAAGGSHFHFCLPVCEGGDGAVAAAAPALGKGPRFIDQPPPPPPPVAVASRTAAGQRVLVVDDDPVNLQVAINHLSAQGLAVTPVSGGTEALALVESGARFDLVLLDIMMPGINGFEVCRRLRHRYSSAELPVIMVTAKNRLTDLVEGLSLGANDYLTKPFAREELLARTRAQLHVRQAHLALEENRLLKERIEQREQTLRQSRERLTAILGGLDQPLVVVNQSGEITLGNRVLEGWLGHGSGALLGQPLTTLFAPETAERLLTTLADLIAAGGLPTAEGGTLTTDPSTPAGRPPPLSPVVIHSANHGVISATLHPQLLELEDEQQLLLILSPGQTLPGAATPSPFLAAQVIGDCREPEAAQGLRRLIVEVMNRALDLWVHHTATTKVELALRSGLWSVYMDRDGWQRTQTLDRYLTLPTLPKRPRRREVIRTAQYVLQHCPGPGSEQEQLAHLLDQLRHAG